MFEEKQTPPFLKRHQFEYPFHISRSQLVILPNDFLGLPMPLLFAPNFPHPSERPSFVGKERPYKKSIWAWKMGFVQDKKVLGGGFKYWDECPPLSSSVTVQSRDGLDEQFSRVTVQSRNSTTNLAKKQNCRWLYLTIVFRASFTFRLRGIGSPCGVLKGIIFYFVNMLTTKYPFVNLFNSDAYFCEAFLLSGLADPAGGFACSNSFWL